MKENEKFFYTNNFRVMIDENIVDVIVDFFLKTL